MCFFVVASCWWFVWYLWSCVIFAPSFVRFLRNHTFKMIFSQFTDMLWSWFFAHFLQGKYIVFHHYATSERITCYQHSTSTLPCHLWNFIKKFCVVRHAAMNFLKFQNNQILQNFLAFDKPEEFPLDFFLAWMSLWWWLLCAKCGIYI